LAKSNRLDSDLLSELPGQQPPWWEVWLAPPAVREQRECMRYRMALVGMQTALKNRIHAVLHRHGILHEYSDLFGVQGRRFLSLLVTEKEWDRLQRGEPPLPESARATLKGYLQTLDQVRRQIARVTREVRQQVRRSPVARRLQTIPGIGWILAYVILAEIGRIERFKNARHLASYSLLAPMANDSGEESPDEPPQGRHVGFIGRRTLKWAFIEAAQTAIRCPGRLKDIYDRRTHGGKRDRNRGVIAVAHELARVVYVVWTQEVDYTDHPPPRPGSSRPTSTSSSRSGTGQPDVAMVLAE
jgi:transposase